MYLKIGSSAKKTTLDSKGPNDLRRQLLQECLSASDSEKAMNYKTTLRKPKESDYRLLLCHGYEVVNYTCLCYQK